MMMTNHEYLRRRNALRSLEGELEMEIASGRGRSEKADSLRHQATCAARIEAEAGKLLADDEALRLELLERFYPEKVRGISTSAPDQQLDEKIEAAVMRILSRTSNPHVTSDGYASDGWPGGNEK